MKRITAFAPAKINLGLRITGRYKNGYHRLETVFAPVSLYDRITLEPAGLDSVSHCWPRGTTLIQKRTLGLGVEKNPLMRKIVNFVRIALKTNAGIELPPQRIIISKQIPSPAGLGGASADAAAVINALGRVYAPAMPALFTSPEFLKSVAALGADIPFFLGYGLAGRAARLSGIGYELSPAEIPKLGGFVIVPPFGFSTAKMFAHVRTLPLLAAEENPQLAPANLTLRLNEIPFSDSLAGRVKIVQNDFDAVAQAVFPAESKLLAGAKKTIALTLGQYLPGQWIIGMTGSGAGLFAAAESTCWPVPHTAIASVLRSRLGGAWSVIGFTTPEKIGP